MCRVLQLLVSPGSTWTKIGTAKKGVLWNFLFELVPLLLVTGALEGAGILHWGGKTGRFSQILQYHSDQVVKIELARIACGLVLVVVAAQIIRWLGDGFDFHPPFRACFTLAVFGFAPYFILRIGYCLPGLNEWVGPALGALGCVFFLYQGVGAVLEPDQTKGFGLYVLSALVFAMFCVMDQLAMLMIMQGRLPG